MLEGRPPPEQYSKPGYYHTSVLDMQYADLIDIGSTFDCVMVLDQPRDQWSHVTVVTTTVSAARALREHTRVEFLDPELEKITGFFEQLVEDNPSFCLLPFMEQHVRNGDMLLCCRSPVVINTLDNFTDWATDPGYVDVRQKMLSGEQIKHCEHCYQREAQGIVSLRKYTTVEWANRLGLTCLDQVSQFDNPISYDVRPSNVCNLQCRTCEPNYSQLINREYIELNFVQDTIRYQPFDFDVIDFENLHKVYVAGGEPTAMAEFYEFLDRCIDNNKTNFELIINTNATKLNSRLKRQLSHFNNVKLVVSIDGHQEVNQYIRWPSEWSVIVDNLRWLQQQQAIKVTFNVTFSIYNVVKLHKLLDWLDQEFPEFFVACESATTPAFLNTDTLSPYRFPDSQLALERLGAIQQLRSYHNHPILASFVDALIAHYRANPVVDNNKLRSFFEFNDQLDQSRGVRLVDYIPELEAQRWRLQ
jgi:sulfatase maturation enzyme AslB (radical SAM superfamily)